MSCNALYLLSPCLYFFMVLKLTLFVCRDDSLTSKSVIMRTGQTTKFFVPEGGVARVKLV